MTNREEKTTPSPSATNGDDPWILVVDAPLAGASETEGGAAWWQRRLLGLSVVLRLALTARAAGARAVVLGPATEIARNSLAGDRLEIPLLSEVESDCAYGSDVRRVHVPSNLVVHRAVLAAVSKSSTQPAITFGRVEDRPLWSSVDAAGGPYGFSPIVVTDEATFAAAEKALLRALRKPQDGWTSTHLNRPISLFITRRLVATPLRPNQVSVAILGVGLLGAFLATRGTYEALVTGAFLFHTQSVLDGCDGEMSRLTFRGSHTGEWLDTVGDDLTNYGFFGGAAWGLYATTGQRLYLALGALTLFCGLVGSGIEYRYLVSIGSGDLLKYPLGIGKAPVGDASPAKAPVARALDAISPLFKRDTFVLLTLLGAVLGALGPLLAIFAAGAVGVLFAVIKAEIRMARERTFKRKANPSHVEKATSGSNAA